MDTIASKDRRRAPRRRHGGHLRRAALTPSRSSRTTCRRTPTRSDCPCLRRPHGSFAQVMKLLTNADDIVVFGDVPRRCRRLVGSGSRRCRGPRHDIVDWVRPSPLGQPAGRGSGERITFSPRGPLRTSDEGDLRPIRHSGADAARSPPPPRKPGHGRELGGPVMVKAQVKAGGRGKAGGVKVARRTAADGRAKAAAILGMDIKGHTVRTRSWSPKAADIDEEYYFSFLLDRATAPTCDVLGRGRHGDRGARGRAAARHWPGCQVDPLAGVDAGEGARDRRAAGQLPARSARGAADVLEQALEGVRRRGGDAGRGEPAGA